LAGAAPHGGEVPLRQMQQLLERSERDGWRAALARLSPELPVGIVERIAEEKRGYFHELLPLREDGIVLDLGAGLGRTAAEFARKYRVMTMGASSEQARFVALRARQDGLSERLAVAQGHVDAVNFLPGQFSAVLIDELPPRTPEAIRFLSLLRALLASGGIIYLAGENRIGWRRLARRLRGQRGFNLHSYAGYARLFAAAGLNIRSSYVSPRGYDDPTLLVPLERRAIYYYSRRMLPPAGRAARRHLITILHLVFANEWMWRRFGSDFVFFLEAADA
jgi:predicted O-methyltransferase YrrM